MNTNYNNLYCDYIGATGIYSISDYIDTTSNILNNKIDITSNFTILNSNILETHLYNTSNTLQSQITATSNLIYKDNNLNTIIRITAQNPYYPLYGDPVEMLFQNVNGDVKTKITQNGELMVYHPLSVLPAGYSPGWWGVENKIANVITDTQGLRFDVTQLQAATGASAITNSTAATAAAAGAVAGAASAAATTAAAGATIASGDYGTVALGVAGGALFSVLGYLSYQAQIESNLTSNGFTTQAAQVHSNIVSVNGLVADNIGNIVTAKGFVHSNVLFGQKYIDSNTVADLYLTKTGKINLNQVNNWISTTYGTYYDITNGTLAINATPTQMDFLKVGGQTTIQGPLIVEGNIKENNLYLSTVYATINNVNIASNTLNNKIDTKQANLTFQSPLLNTANTISINLGSYSTTGTDPNYLLKTGGTMTGSLILPNTIWSIKSVDNVNRINYATNGATYFKSGNTTGNSFVFKNTADTTEILTISNTGDLTTTGLINAATNLQENGVNLTSKYLQLTGGAMTGQITGVTTLNGTTGIFGKLQTTNNTNAGVPSLGITGGTGDKLILYSGTASFHPYSLGIYTNELWYSVPYSASHSFYVNGTPITTINNKGLEISIDNPILTIKSALETQKSIIYISTPFNSSSAVKTAIIAEGYSGWGRSKLHFCLNNSGNPPGTGADYNNAPTYNATITDARMTILPNGNVGIGSTIPSQILDVIGNIKCSANIDIGVKLNVPNITLGSGGKINSYDDYHYIHISQPTDTLTIQEYGKIIFSIGQAKTEIGRINSSGLTITGDFIVKGKACIYNGSTSAVQNNFMASGSLTIGDTGLNYGTATGWTTNTAGLMMECSDYTEICVHDHATRITSLMYYDGIYNKIYIGRNKGWGDTQTQIVGNLTLPADRFIYSSDALRPRLYFVTNGYNIYQSHGPLANAGHVFQNGDATQLMQLNNNGNLEVGGQITCLLYTISGSYRDLLGVYVENTSVGSFGNYQIKVIQGTFTGFHRCFTDDELFNKDEPQLFKDNYEGRIVISTGKIATDTNDNIEDWEIKYDKEGITIEDALPKIELSRKKKDKRVFGVLGASKRNNNRPERLIINSVGEGGIWVCNSNGYIENGDYITSSDYLGYGEKQDEIFLCNYTVAKATMDCNFELNSPLYNSIEIDGGLIISFIACTYHCG